MPVFWLSGKNRLRWLKLMGANSVNCKCPLIASEPDLHVRNKLTFPASMESGILPLVRGNALLI